MEVWILKKCLLTVPVQNVPLRLSGVRCVALAHCEWCLFGRWSAGGPNLNRQKLNVVLSWSSFHNRTWPYLPTPSPTAGFDPSADRKNDSPCANPHLLSTIRHRFLLIPNFPPPIITIVIVLRASASNATRLAAKFFSSTTFHTYHKIFSNV